MVKPSGDVLQATEWLVQQIPSHDEAVGVLKRWHYAKNAGSISTYRHGLYRPLNDVFVGDLYGVALWLPTIKPSGQAVAGDDWQGVLMLSRLAIDPSCPTNSASFLLGRSMKMIDRDRWPVLVTYADTRHGHTGVIYRATNWRCDGETSGGQTGDWVDGDGRMRSYRQGVTFSASQMTERGFTRLPHMPKIRFVHDVRRSSTGR